MAFGYFDSDLTILDKLVIVIALLDFGRVQLMDIDFVGSVLDLVILDRHLVFAVVDFLLD